MRNKLKYFSLWLCAFLMFVSAVSLNEVRADDNKYPEHNNYSYYIMDNADVLTDSEERLCQVLVGIFIYSFSTCQFYLWALPRPARALPPP